ncbi:MAG TPA: oligosaccharide flippase family protein [Bacteroidota bacterium]|nr:oligosaccharide flippase family protein [Bacteroidota bacterium]
MAGEAAKSVSRTIGVLSFTKVLTWIASSALMFFLPRYLGPAEYGKLYLGMSVVAMLGIIVDFGREYSVSKQISRDRDHAAQIVVNTSSARLLIGVLAYVGMLVFADIAKYPDDVKLIFRILGIMLLWRGLNSVLWSYFQGVEQMKWPSYGSIIESFLLAALSIPFLLMGAKAATLASIVLFCGAVNVVVCSGFAWRLIHYIPRVDWHAALRSLKQGIPYFLNSLFGVIYYRVATVMLSLMATETVVGWYGASYRFFDIIMFIPSIFSISIYPVLARSFEDKEGLARMTRKSLDFILLLGIPIAIGTIAYSPVIIRLIFGLKGYQESITVLRVLGAGILLVYIDMMLGTTLLASDRQRQLSISAFLAIFVNVGINLWLIPYTQARFGNGGIGAGIATNVTEFFIMITMIIMMPKHILRDSKVSVQLKAIAAGCVMILTIYLASLVGIHWIISATVSSLVYCGLVYALGAVSRSELALIESAIPIGKFLALKRGKS